MTPFYATCLPFNQNDIQNCKNHDHCAGYYHTHIEINFIALGVLIYCGRILTNEQVNFQPLQIGKENSVLKQFSNQKDIKY